MDEFLYMFSLIVKAIGFQLLCLLVMAVVWLTKLFQLFKAQMENGWYARRMCCGLFFAGAHPTQLVGGAHVQIRPKSLSAPDTTSSHGLSKTFIRHTSRKPSIIYRLDLADNHSSLLHNMDFIKRRSTCRVRQNLDRASAFESMAATESDTGLSSSSHNVVPFPKATSPTVFKPHRIPAPVAIPDTKPPPPPPRPESHTKPSGSSHSLVIEEPSDPNQGIIELSSRSSSNSSNSSTSSSTKVSATGHRETVKVNTFEGPHYTTTRTVIRPVIPPFSRGFSNLFSRSLILGHHRLHHRSGNPLDAMAFNNSMLFERELDARQTQWRLEDEGANAVQVRVVEEQKIIQEERWRALVQEMSYRTRPTIGSIPILGDYEHPNRRRGL